MVLQSPLKTVWSFFTLATLKYLKVHTVLLMWVIKSPGTDGQEEIVDSHRAVQPDLWNRKYKPPLAVVSPCQPKDRQSTKDGHGHGRDEMASSPRSH